MPKRMPSKTRQSDFRLPPGVSMQKEQLPAGWAYVFRHAELGLLGRLVLQGLPSGHCQVSCEVVGDPADSLTARRRKVLEPMTTALVRQLFAVACTRLFGPVGLAQMLRPCLQCPRMVYGSGIRSSLSALPL